MSNKRIKRLEDLQDLLKNGQENLTKDELAYVKKSFEQIHFSLAEDMVKRDPNLILMKNGMIIERPFPRIFTPETNFSDDLKTQ